MKTASNILLSAMLVLGLVQASAAQTADEIIEKHLAAVGGRAALAKLKSRSITGTITLSLPVGGDVTGSIEVLNQAPNKSRSLIKVDLSALGVGMVTQEQRFDGTVGYALDTLQGNRDITGDPLNNLKNASFPSVLLTYKDAGMTVELGGKEKVGDREAYVLTLTPKTGSVVRQYLDAQSFLPVKQTLKVNVPQLGTDVEQTTELNDYREVDGVKIPFRIRTSSMIQTFTINITKVEHNITIDQTLFSKP